MQLTTMTMSLALLLTSTIVAGSALPLTATAATFEDYELVPAVFSGTYNGHEYTLQGDIQAVSAQLEALYGPSTDGNVARSDVILDRATNSKTGLQCIPIGNQHWQYANSAAIAQSVSALQRRGGSTPVNGHSCSRLSCLTSSAIYLCNDNNGGIDPQLNYIASYASDIINRCGVAPPFGPALAAGQEFDTDNYNVIVREDGC